MNHTLLVSIYDGVGVYSPPPPPRLHVPVPKRQRKQEEEDRKQETQKERGLLVFRRRHMSNLPNKRVAVAETGPYNLTQIKPNMKMAKRQKARIEQETSNTESQMSVHPVLRLRNVGAHKFVARVSLRSLSEIRLLRERVARVACALLEIRLLLERVAPDRSFWNFWRVAQGRRRGRRW